MALVLACVTLALRKTGVVAERPARVALGVLTCVPLVAALVAFARRLDAQPLRAGAIVLDRFHGLADRLSSALAFAREPAPTPFMLAAIDDAVDRVPVGRPAARRPDPRPAAPRGGGRPRAARSLAIALFEVRHHAPAVHVQTIDAVDVTADDLDAMRDFLDQMKAHEQTDEAKAATREFNQLIEDLAARRLDRTEAFRRMQQLEDKLLQGREADARALEEAMKKIGEEMKTAELTRPAGEALDVEEPRGRGEAAPGPREEAPREGGLARQVAARQDARSAEAGVVEPVEAARGPRAAARGAAPAAIGAA